MTRVEQNRKKKQAKKRNRERDKGFRKKDFKGRIMKLFMKGLFQLKHN